MRIPKRRSEQNKAQPNDGPIYLTQEGFDKLKADLARLERNLPHAIAEVERTKEYGDFSENEEYKAAKRRMRGMHSRIFTIKHQLERVQIIDERSNTSGVVQIGTTVTLESGGNEKVYQIVGPHEADPSNGRISHESPLGAVLIGKRVGDTVTLKTGKAFLVRSIA